MTDIQPPDGDSLKPAPPEGARNLDYATVQPDGALTAPPRGALTIIFFIVVIDLFGFGVIIPLLPFYALKCKATPLQVTIMFSVYSICQFVASPILGALSDRYGRRPVLVFSQLGSAAGYVLL